MPIPNCQLTKIPEGSRNLDGCPKNDPVQTFSETTCTTKPPSHGKIFYYRKHWDSVW